MSDERVTVDLVTKVSGTGPVTVLLHGITEEGRSWDPLVPPLAEDGTVVVVDLRGHGASPEAESYDLPSMAADVKAALDGLGLGGDAEDAPLVVGHSMGGLVAVAYAAAYPVRGAIAVDQQLDLAGFQAQVRELEPMLRGDGLEMAIGMVFDAMRGPLSDAEFERIAAFRRPRRSVVLGVWAPLLELERADLDVMVEQMTGGVQAPVLSLHGIDPGQDYATWLQQRVPTAEVEVWADHGHYPQLVDPDRFLDRVRGFDPLR